MQSNKIYINVYVFHDTDGHIHPFMLLWADGRKYKIEKVLEVKQAASMKAGGQGDRFTVQIKGQERYLFFEHNTKITGDRCGRWFVEARTPA